eukprot:5181380-Prymnesium_polylepis.1
MLGVESRPPTPICCALASSCASAPVTASAVMVGSGQRGASGESKGESGSLGHEGEAGAPTLTEPSRVLISIGRQHRPDGPSRKRRRRRSGRRWGRGGCRLEPARWRGRHLSCGPRDAPAARRRGPDGVQLADVGFPAKTGRAVAGFAVTPDHNGTPICTFECPGSSEA